MNNNSMKNLFQLLYQFLAKLGEKCKRLSLNTAACLGPSIKAGLNPKVVGPHLSK